MFIPTFNSLIYIFLILTCIQANFLKVHTLVVTLMSRRLFVYPGSDGTCQEKHPSRWLFMEKPAGLTLKVS